jgi:PAS domain S-box-containing protein
VSHTLDDVVVPTYVVDRVGLIRWVNPAARELVGDARGRRFTSVVAPEETLEAREHFARELSGSERVTDAEVVLLDDGGGRVDADISSVPLLGDHRIVGVFGQISEVAVAAREDASRHLDSGQTQVLRLLSRGASTEQIGEMLQLSRETVRNHVRGLLRALGVDTRLEAVVAARRIGIG